MAGTAATSAGFLGADVDELDRGAMWCREAAGAAGRATGNLVPLLREPWASGPFHKRFTGFLRSELIPALDLVWRALDGFEDVLRAHAEAQRLVSAGQPADLAALPHYASPLASLPHHASPLADGPQPATVVPAAAPGDATRPDLESRHAANAALVREELRTTQGELAAARGALERAEQDHQESNWLQRQLAGSRLEHAGERVEGLERRAASYQQLLRDDVTILEFDPDAYGGDGHVVAQVGAVGAQTRNVGILVPGMGTDLGNVGDYVRHARTFVDRDLAMVVWMGGDLPDTVGDGAWSAGYARLAAPDLAEFSADVRQRLERFAEDYQHDLRQAGAGGARVTAVGHSYGGLLAGTAAAGGADFDRLVHVASAGSGFGVDEISDYSAPDRDGDGNPDPLLGVYSLTAPGDSIEGWQGGISGRGVDPDELAGVRPLPAGDPATWEGPDPSLRPDPDLSRGNEIHGYYYFDPDTTAWREIKAVLEGERDPSPSR